MNFFNIRGLSKRSLVGIYLLKCVFAFLYYYVHSQLIHAGDIFLYLKDADVLFDLLKENPIKYFRLVFGPNGGEVPVDLSVPIHTMWYWKDPSAYFMVRLHAIFRLFSFGHHGVHAIFTALISFFGILMIIKAVQTTHKRVSSFFIWAIFCFPSILFWTSGYHKETAVTFAFGIYIYSIFRICDGRMNWKDIVALLVGVILLVTIRDFFFWLSIPAIIALLASRWVPKYSVVVYLLVYLIFMSVGSLVEIPGLEKNYLEYIEMKRTDYLSLKTGNTHFDPPVYNPTLAAFVKAIPASHINGFLRPFPADTDTLLSKLAMVENFIIILTILFVISGIRVIRHDLPFILFMIFLGLSIIAATGLVVPNTGALLRYRSIGLLLFLPALFNLKPNFNLR